MRRIENAKRRPKRQNREANCKFKADRMRLSRWSASEAIYKYIFLRHVAGRRFVLGKSVRSLHRRRFSVRGSPLSVINNRIIRRSRSNASLATLSDVISSGLIARYYFDVRHESATRRGGEREEARSHFTEHEPRLYSRNNANVIVNYEHLKYNGVRDEEKRDEWRGNRKNREGS